jgi:DNA-binding GntR family transcriptional regulator
LVVHTRFGALHAARYAILHADMTVGDRQAVGASATPLATLRSDEIYDRLRADIVQGVLRPNQRLVELDLAERLGVSRTPIRETLQRLALDGLVRRDRSGWVVHEHSPEEIRSIYEVRAALEGYAAFLAAGRATEDQLRALDDLYPPGDAAFALPPDEQVELNQRFHDGVIAAAGNSRLAQLCGTGRHYYFNHRIARRYDSEETRRSIEGHRRILTALAQGNGPAAEAHAREHVDYALSVVLAKVT